MRSRSEVFEVMRGRTGNLTSLGLVQGVKLSTHLGIRPFWEVFEVVKGQTASCLTVDSPVQPRTTSKTSLRRQHFSDALIVTTHIESGLSLTQFDQLEYSTPFRNRAAAKRTDIS